MGSNQSDTFTRRLALTDALDWWRTLTLRSSLRNMHEHNPADSRQYRQVLPDILRYSQPDNRADTAHVRQHRFDNIPRGQVRHDRLNLFGSCHFQGSPTE